MKFVCNKCKTKYSIADEKVRRKVLKIRCKNCSNIIIVREPTGSAVAPAPPRSPGSGVRPLARAFDGAFGRQRSPSSGLSPLPSAARAVADLAHVDEYSEPEQTRLSDAPDFLDEAVPAEDEWYLAVDNNQYGPMGFNELCSRVKRGEAAGESYVWRDGFDDWLEPNDVPELRPFLPKHPPPPPRGKSGLYNLPAAVQAPSMLSPEPGPTPRSPFQTIPEQRPPTGQEHPKVQAPPSSVFPPGSVSPAPQVSPLPSPATTAPTAPTQGPGSNVAPIPVPPDPTSPPIQPPPAQPEADFAPLPPAVGPSQEMPPVTATPAPQPGRAPAWMVIAGVGGGLAAICGLFLVGYFLFFDRPEEQPAAVAVAPTQERQPTPEPAVPDMGAEAISFPPMEIEQTTKDERQVRRNGRRRPRPRPATPPSDTTAGKKLSAKQRALMDLYKKEGPASKSPKDVARRRRRSGPTRRITANELMALQRRHRATLKACYERALKRDNTLSELKAEVQVAIGDSGIVRSVKIAAGNNPDLIACIKRSIKRWAFPAVGAQSFSFPIIFRGT
jgi:predicted Zn finger-like uncharacterized protein